jgi:septal ring factor EnvC (AmiA/AmiB activator)
MFACQRSVWSVYKVAGEAYGSKLVGHYCSPGSAYLVALSKQLDKHEEEAKVFLQNKKYIRDELHKLQYELHKLQYELHKLQHEAINSKDFLNKTIYHVKTTEYYDGLILTKCESCPSCPPSCLR